MWYLISVIVVSMMGWRIAFMEWLVSLFRILVGLVIDGWISIGIFGFLVEFCLSCLLEALSECKVPQWIGLSFTGQIVFVYPVNLLIVLILLCVICNVKFGHPMRNLCYDEHNFEFEDYTTTFCSSELISMTYHIMIEIFLFATIMI